MDKETSASVKDKDPRLVWHAPVIETVELTRTLSAVGSITDGVDGSIT